MAGRTGIPLQVRPRSYVKRERSTFIGGVVVGTILSRRASCIAIGLIFVLVGVAGCLSGERSQIPGPDERSWTVTEQSELDAYLEPMVGEDGVDEQLLTRLHHQEVSVEVHGSGSDRPVTIEAGCGWSANHTVRVHWDDGRFLGMAAPDPDGCVRAANGIRATQGAPPTQITLPDGPALPAPGTYTLFLFGHDEDGEPRLEAGSVHVSPSLITLPAEDAADGIPAGFGETLSRDQAGELGSDTRDRREGERTVGDDVLAGCGWPADTEVDLSAQPPPGTNLPDDEHRDVHEALGTVTTDGEGCFAARFDGDRLDGTSDSGMVQVTATAAGLGNELARQAAEVIQVAMEEPTLSVPETDVGPGDPVEFVTCGWDGQSVDVGWLEEVDIEENNWPTVTVGGEDAGPMGCSQGSINAPNPSFGPYEENRTYDLQAAEPPYVLSAVKAPGWTDAEPVEVTVHKGAYVALGDSMTSGEGAGVNAHIGIEPGDWNDRPYAFHERTYWGGTGAAVEGEGKAGCHRDTERAFPQRVGNWLERPTINVGCSGSYISEGLLGAFDPWHYGRGPTVDAQLEQVQDRNPGNIEFVTVTTGGNEVNFGHMLAYCSKKDPGECLDQPIDDEDEEFRATWRGIPMRDMLKGEEIRFAKNLSYLGEKLKATFDVPPERILIPSYFDPAGPRGNCEPDFVGGMGYETETVHDLRSEVLPKLNGMLYGWAEHEGFTFVPGITPMFQGHGVCDRNDPNDGDFRDPRFGWYIGSDGETDESVRSKLFDRWIVRIVEDYNFWPAWGAFGEDGGKASWKVWLDIKEHADDLELREPFHPNRFGQEVIAGCVKHEMRELDPSIPQDKELYPGTGAHGRDCPKHDLYGIYGAHVNSISSSPEEEYCENVETDETTYFEGSEHVETHGEVPPTYPPIPCDATEEEIQSAFDQVMYSELDVPTGEYRVVAPDLTTVETDEESAVEEALATEQTDGLAIDTAYVFADGSLRDGLLANSHDDLAPSAALLIGPEGLTGDQRERLSDQVSPEGEVFVVGEITETQPNLADEIRAEGFEVTTVGGEDPLATSVAARQDSIGSIRDADEGVGARDDADERAGVLATALRGGDPHPSTTFASVMIGPASPFLNVPEDATGAELSDALAATVGPGRLARGDVTIHEVGPWDIPAANELAGQDGLWFGFEDSDGSGSPDPGEAVYLCSDCQRVTEGDRRIAYDGEARPGSRVTSEDEDLGRTLTLFPGAVGYADADGDGELALGSGDDAVMLMPAHGDVRPGSVWLSGSDAGTWVESGDAVLEAGTHVPVTGGAIPAFVDHAGDRDLGPRDGLYLDVDADGSVSPGDVRWSGRQPGSMVQEDDRGVGQNLTWAPRVGRDLTVTPIATSDPGGFTEQLLAETGLENVCDGASHLNLAPVPATAAEGTPRPTDLHRGFLVSALHGEPLLPVDDGSGARHLAGFLDHAPPPPPEVVRHGLLGLVSTSYHEHMERGAECRPSVDLYELSSDADVDAAAAALRPAMEREVWHLT